MAVELIDDDDLLIFVAEEPGSAFHCGDGADVFSEVLITDVLGLAGTGRTDDDGDPRLEVACRLKELDGFFHAGMVLDVGFEVLVHEFAKWDASVDIFLARSKISAFTLVTRFTILAMRVRNHKSLFLRFVAIRAAIFLILFRRSASRNEMSCRMDKLFETLNTPTACKFQIALLMNFTSSRTDLVLKDEVPCIVTNIIPLDFVIHVMIGETPTCYLCHRSV